jgi:hypothetical protein
VFTKGAVLKGATLSKVTRCFYEYFQDVLCKSAGFFGGVCMYSISV